MASGLLEIVETLHVGQFGPLGGSIPHLRVDVAARDFRFRPNPDPPFRLIRAFDRANVHGAVDDASRHGWITVRLQGLDAPALHSRPASALSDRRGRPEEQKRLSLQSSARSARSASQRLSLRAPR